MQSSLPNTQGGHSETYKPSEFSEFFQENWIYLAIVLVIIYIVVMYMKILKDRRKNKSE